MPNSKYTDITVIMDRSGSMMSIRNDMVGGFDKFIAEQKEIKADICKVTLMQFDNDGFDVVYEARDIQGVPGLTLSPRGTTPLLDAIAKTIHKTGDRLSALAEDDRPGNVVFIIITDGQENASREYKRDAVKALIERQQSQWKWNFVYMGANQDAYAEASGIGIPILNTVNYAASTAGVSGAIGATSSNLSGMRVNSLRGHSTKGTLTYTKAQQDVAMGKTDDKEDTPKA